MRAAWKVSVLALGALLVTSGAVQADGRQSAETVVRSAPDTPDTPGT
ncbi:hypothetical protein G6045_28120, partial [Streptomyces sp. YC504]|nr:hypothetical protein [Streptomyces mesophilus]